MRTVRNTAFTDADVEKATARILEIMDEQNRLIKAGNRAVRYADHRLVIEENDIRSQLAAEFGRRHQWMRAKRDFSIEVLAGRLHHSGLDYARQASFGCHYDLFDHPYCYRDVARPYRAAAVVAHLYNNSAEKPGNLSVLAGQLGLTVSWPDFPSWWYPGRTHLVLVTPIGCPLTVAA